MKKETGGWAHLKKTYILQLKKAFLTYDSRFVNS